MTAVFVWPAIHALLADGTTVCIRAVEPEDRDQLHRLYEEMSPESLRMRFFAVSPGSAALAADHACEPARPGRRALVAGLQGRIISLAEYDEGDERGSADLAVAVAEGLHHRGVGTLLVEHLASAARADGITLFRADALSENREVMRLFTDLGLRVTRRADGPETRCTITLDQDDTYLRAVEDRGRAADLASMEPLFRPRTVAVVGVGRRPGSVGRAVLRHLTTGGFTGRLFAVNPHAHALLGVPSCPAVR